MKNQRHKRKESYSVLVVSNLDRNSRQFHIARSALRLLALLILMIFAAVGYAAYLYTVNSRHTEKLRVQLQEQLLAQEELVRQWDEEKYELNAENEELEAQLAALREELEQAKETAAAEAEAAEKAALESDPAYPSRYPSTGIGVLASTFSEEHPYISFTVESGSNVIAAGDGVVTSIDSDDEYRYIIEVDYENGYRTRYLYGQNAELKVEAGARVLGGDTLLTITVDDTRLDYQVLYEETPVDPLSVIAAKG